MSVEFSPAVRDRVGLLIAIAGGTGSGKSLSALKIARGLAARTGENLSDPETLTKVDARIAALDTEAGRLKHYAPAPGEKPSNNTFGFMHGDMKPPFTPSAYADNIAAADSAGFEVIIVDSGSHEWAGEGGVSDMQEEALEAAVERAKAAHDSENRNYAFDEDKTRERMGMACWKQPKQEHKRLVSRLLQCRAHVILCLRAEEKIRMETVEQEGSNGRKYKKTVITQPKDMPIHERWQPLCEKKLPFEFTVSLLLTMDQPGYPIPLKLEEQHKTAIPLDKPLCEETGRMLAAWARGGAPKAIVAPLDDLPEAWSTWSSEERGLNRATKGMIALSAWWKTLPAAEQKALKPTLDSTWKPEATMADKAKS